jgi:tetratricopeptide (TPR) repeat protein
MNTAPSAGLDIVEVLTQALAQHRAGQLDQAAEGYETVLASDPDQPNALYLLGSLRMGQNRLDDAAGLLERSYTHQPTHADTLLQLGNALFRQGKVAAARARWNELVALRPTFADAHANLAQAALADGDPDAAIAAARVAVELNPELAEGWTNLGNAQLAKNALEDAIGSYRTALSKRATPLIRTNLANAMQRAGSLEAALAGAELALEEDPNLFEARLVETRVLRELGFADRALRSAQKAVDLAPNSAPAAMALGNAQFDLDHLDTAKATYTRALELDPTLAEAHANLGFLLTAQAEYDAAIVACDRSIALRPDFAEAHWNKGFAHLLSGDYLAGWAKYEWRKRHPRFADAFAQLAGAEWQGEGLTGKTLLVHAEQGLGDSIHFVRFADTLAKQGATVVMACARPLVSLLGRAPGIALAVDRNLPLPAYDYWVDQMSLPLLLGVTPDNIAPLHCYLGADPERVSAWDQILPAGRRAGLVWGGNPLHSNDRRRSAPVETLKPVVQVPGWSFVSLQVGPRAREVESLPGVLDVTDALEDFEATAALIESLDVVIAVDTAVAHLAGALGRPTFLLLPHAPDWRWLPSRPDDTPWYVSMRLFRQPHPGDWDDVMARVSAALADFSPAG